MGYLTIIRRRRSEYWWIFPETKSRGIFTNIREPEANNCFSIITQVIIEKPKQRNVTILPQFAIVDKSSNHAARINVSRNAFLNSRSEEKNIFFTLAFSEYISETVFLWEDLICICMWMKSHFRTNG